MLRPFTLLFQKSALNRRVLVLAVPVLLGMVNHTAVMVADTAMVGQLGKNATAATTIGGILVWTFIALFAGLAVGIQILAAHRFGEKDHTGVRGVLRSGLLISILSGALFAVGGYYLAPKIVLALSDDAVVQELAGPFVAYRFAGSIVLFPVFALRAFFDGLGLTLAGLYSAIATTISNIFLNWVLIYGNLGAPALGVEGAGIASSLAAVFALIAFIPYMFHPVARRYFKALLPRKERPRPESLAGRAYMGKVLEVGFAPGVEQFSIHIAFLLFTRLSALASTLILAANGIVFTIISISFMPGFAFGIAATTILGQAIGAGQSNRGIAGSWRSANYAAVVMAVLGIIFILFGNTIAGWMTTDPQVQKEAYRGLIVAGCFQAADAYHMVIGSALRAAGHFWWVLRVYLIVSFAVMLPLAALLGILLGLGTVGFWLAIATWLGSLSVLFSLKFKKRDWETAGETI